jgi:RNA polymerase sigma-70 factor (ECF subfamily)
VQEDADEALVARCRSGDGPEARQGFAALVSRYERPVFNLAYRMLGDREDARDVAQTAFLKALESLHRFDPRYRFFSWLYRIALNEALDVLGRRGRQTELTDVHAAEDDLLGAVTAADLGARVRGALGAMTQDHQAVLVLRHYQELSYEQIAEVLELSDSTVKSRLFEARERLRARLAADGVEQ